MAEGSIERYHLLDAFRGMGILWIVCYHVLGDVQEYYGSILNFIIRYGYLGVSIFFVISGYGISSTLHHSKSIEPRVFLWRRLKRIYPLYWWQLFFSAIIIPLILSAYSSLRTHSFSFELIPYSKWEWLQVATLIKIFTSKSWYLDRSFGLLNGPVWFIAVLVQIYFFVSLCLCFRKRAFLMLFMGFVASCLALVPQIQAFIPYGFFLPLYAQFYLGFIIHYLIRNQLIPKSKLFTGSVLGLILCLCGLCVIFKSDYLSISFSILAAFVFLILHKYDSNLFRLRGVKIFYCLGLFSYSCYLIHLPLWPLVGMFISDFVPIRHTLAGPLILVPGLLVLSFIWHLFFEKPPSQLSVIKSLGSPIRTIVSGVRDMKDVFKKNDNF